MISPPDHSRVRAALDRAHRLDGRLRAFLEIRVDDAGEGSSGESRLAGLPVTVKGRAGLRSPTARRVLRAGAVSIGTTSVPVGGGHQTWGHTARGPTRNPWRPDRSPGGSSAGAAAAVAAGIVGLSCGGDGAGSVRIPAAWCATIGLKPGTGRVPVTDPTGLAVPGVIVRDPRLLRAWCTAVYDDGATRPARSVTSARWSPDLGYAAPHLDSEVAGIAEAAARDLCARAGIGLDRSPVTLVDPHDAWAALRGPSPAGAGRRLVVRTRRENDDRLDDAFRHADLLMTPTTPGPPHGHHGPGTHLSVALTWAFNLSGHPAISVPAGFTGDGCPVGLQIVARHGEDESLLRFVERHVPTAPVATV